jgi:hypothetical protein
MDVHQKKLVFMGIDPQQYHIQKHHNFCQGTLQRSKA